MIGELAALATAFIWSIGSLFFTSAGRCIGALNVNRIRLILGVVLLGLTLFLTKGWLLPPGITDKSILYLALSGIIGLVIGDSFLFSAMVILGTRMTMLIYALSPAIAAITAYFFIGESLDILSITGIFVTLAGVIWVTRERRFDNNNGVVKVSTKGIIFAFLGGTGQAIGIVFAKMGMEKAVDPLAGTFLRMCFAAATIWIVSLLTGSIIKTIRSLKNHRGVLLSFGGTLFGPFLGVWMSLVAVKNTQAGVAMAIMSIVPVLVIPWVIIFYKERVSPRAFWGALVAVLGVFILFLH